MCLRERAQEIIPLLAEEVREETSSIRFLDQQLGRSLLGLWVLRLRRLGARLFHKSLRWPNLRLGVRLLHRSLRWLSLGWLHRSHCWRRRCPGRWWLLPATQGRRLSHWRLSLGLRPLVRLWLRLFVVVASKDLLGWCAPRLVARG